MDQLPGQVPIEKVLEILQIINHPPNIREQPLPGDLEGEFDYWFDGGAIQYVTGYTIYRFKDGTEATWYVVPKLSLSIEFANGMKVGIVQE